jgi:hypothetical protein
VRVALKEAATVKESVYSILMKKRPLCHFDEGEIYSSEFTGGQVRVALKEAATVKESVYSILM